jgi:ketol-acid reductoisomerase
LGRAYDAVHPIGLELTREIYDEVSSGNEIRSVIVAGKRFARFPMSKINQSDIWQAGQAARRDRDDSRLPLDPFTAGIFCGVMMAQIDTLIEKGHPYSEIASESVIEATDSLNPYMRARGVSYMIDNCSTTARLGARKWAPRFDYLIPNRGQLREAGRPAARPPAAYPASRPPCGSTLYEPPTPIPFRSVRPR